MSWRDLYPFAGKHLEVEGGHKLHYLDEGDPGAPPLLLVHGNPTWSFYYRNLVTHFRDRFRVIVPDHIGCGLSDKPQRYDYRVGQHIGNLQRLVETLDLQRVSLGVHDWGGPIGLGTASLMPERFRRLTVFNTSAWLGGRLPLRIRVCRIPLFGSLAVRGFNAFAWTATWNAVSKRLPPDVKAGYLAPYDSWANRIATLRFVEDIPLAKGHPSWQTLDALERRHDALRGMPMMIVWGMRDWCFTPAFLAEWRERFPEAVVHELADAHHLVVEDADARVRELMDAHLAPELA